MSTIGSLNVDGSTLDASLLGIIFTMARHHHDDRSNLLHGLTTKIVASESVYRVQTDNFMFHHKNSFLSFFFSPQTAVAFARKFNKGASNARNPLP